MAAPNAGPHDEASDPSTDPAASSEHAPGPPAPSPEPPTPAPDRPRATAQEPAVPANGGPENGEPEKGSERSVPATDPAPVPRDRADVHDLDARWADIVAELSDMSELGGLEAVEKPAVTDGPGRPRDLHDTFPVAPWVQSGPRDWPTTPEVEALDEADSHFVPPDPPLVLGRDPLLTMAWSVVAGIPVILLIALVVIRPFPAHVGQVAGALFLVGLGILLWRMPHRRDDDDGPGAVV